MKSADNKVLASMIVSLEQRVLSELGDLKEGHTTLVANQSELSKIQATILANQQSAREVHLTFREELLGSGGRVSELEDRQKSHEFWHNVKIVIVLPVTFALHKLGTVLGLKL